MIGSHFYALYVNKHLHNLHWHRANALLFWTVCDAFPVPCLMEIKRSRRNQNNTDFLKIWRRWLIQLNRLSFNLAQYTRCIHITKRTWPYLAKTTSKCDRISIPPQCILGKFTPVLRAVYFWSDHPRHMLVSARCEQGHTHIYIHTHTHTHTHTV